jgi:hypothetical protein
MDFNKIIISLIPLLLVAMWWVVDSINTINRDVALIKSHLTQLITPAGQVIPSTDNLVERQKLKETLVENIHGLDIRLKLVEERYVTGNSCGGKMYSDWPCMNAEGCIKLGK